MPCRLSDSTSLRRSSSKSRLKYSAFVPLHSACEEGDNFLVSLRETITAHGHPNILATHPSTLEITKEPSLTRKGDCIIAVGADKSAEDLSARLKRLLMMEDSRVKLTIEADGIQEVLGGRGDPRLSFRNRECMVFRKSKYVCERTVMIQSNKAAAGLNRNLVNILQQEKAKVELTIEVSA